MPILDLLASITGEEPSPAPAVVARPSVPLPKRKAEDELRSAGPKVARTNPVAEKPYRPTAVPPKPSARPADRPLGGSSDSRQPVKPRPTLDRKPAATGSRFSGAGTTSSNASKPLPARPLANRPSPTDSGPPKKRSYAEIMARAKAGSELRESLGKIQHKTVERSMTMKERKEMKAEEATKTKMERRKAMASSRPGVPSSRPGASSMPARDVAKSSGSRNAPIPPAPTSAKKAAPVEEKKVKKAALATTGYTGTARPRPGASAASKSGATGRGGSETQPRERSRYGGPLSTRRRREEDEEMDDFIVDDEEDEEQQGYDTGRQYRYDSYDDESDMEAGISDIEDEEQTADRYARREDQEQEALEKRLKREKEERKRKFLDSAKSKAGSR